MLIARNKIVNLLKARGQEQRAEWVERDLPEIVDTERHRGLLDLLRIDLDGIDFDSIDDSAGPADQPPTRTSMRG
jgi:hypothetical protein